MELIARQKAAQAVINKYLMMPFEWGVLDCVHLAADALIFNGYPDPLAGVQPYNDLRSALKAMKAANITDMAAHLDSLGFERIAPAAALPCDLVSLPGMYDMLALGIAIGGQRILCFADPGKGIRGAFTTAGEAISAWRIKPIVQAAS